MKMKLSDIEFDERVYPRPQKDKDNVRTLADKLKAGIELDPATVQKVKYENGEVRTIMLNGGHRLDAYDLENRDEMPVEFWKDGTIPFEEYMDAMLIFAHQANDEQGLNMRSIDTRHVARMLRRRNPSWSAKKIGEKLHRGKSTVHSYIQDIIQEQRSSEQQLIFNLRMTGWTQQEIADKIGKNQGSISKIMQKSELGKVHTLFQRGKNPEDIAEMFDLSIPAVWHIILEGKNDLERFEEFGDTEYGNTQPKVYDHWSFAKRDPRIGQEFPGMLWGQDVMNILYRFSKQGDLVVDPMAGGGSVLDSCLIMNRRCRAYDIDPKRPDILKHDITRGFPREAHNCNLIVFDPPYYKKKEEEYKSWKITKDKQTFLRFVEDFAQNAYVVLKPFGHLALIYSQYLEWDGGGDWKNEGVYDKELIERIDEAGFIYEVMIQTPYGTSHFEGHDVEKAKQHDPWHILPISRSWHIFSKKLKPGQKLLDWL